MPETPVQFLSWEGPLEKGRLSTPGCLGFPGGSDSKESAGNVGNLGWEGPLEEGMATHSRILAWRIPRDRGARRLQSTGSQRVRQLSITHSTAPAHLQLACKMFIVNLSGQDFYLCHIINTFKNKTHLILKGRIHTNC